LLGDEVVKPEVRGAGEEQVVRNGVVEEAGIVNADATGGDQERDGQGNS